MHKLLIFIGLVVSFTAYGQEYTHVFVFLNSKADKAEISEEQEIALQKSHRANIGRLVKEDKMVVAGPFEGGGGIFILNTRSVSQAQAWLETDPAVKANRWDIEMYPVSFKHGGACIAREPHEMVVYDFIRVHLINDIANYKMNQTNNDFWKLVPDSVLMSGAFPQSDGGIIVYNGAESTTWFGEDQDERIRLEHNKIWVVKGSFCE